MVSIQLFSTTDSGSFGAVVISLPSSISSQFICSCASTNSVLFTQTMTDLAAHCAVTSSHALAKRIEICSSVHRALDCLKLTDMAFRATVGPWLIKRRSHNIDIAMHAPFVKRCIARLPECVVLSSQLEQTWRFVITNHVCKLACEIDDLFNGGMSGTDL